MAREDRVPMSQKDFRRLHVIERYLEGQIDQHRAAELLKLSMRQVRRLGKRYQAEGASGLVHRLRGRSSNHGLSPEQRAQAISIYRQRYIGFGPTLAAEKIGEHEGIVLSKETLRTILLQSGDWQKGRKRSIHRQWRVRKEQAGMLIQLDGSHHDWFEGRRAKSVLMAYIDDATSEVYARFYEYEGTIPAMDSPQRYMKKHGIPIKLYTDRHSTYKSPLKEPDVYDEDGNSVEALSQFERACKELGIEITHAHSPQAKGRIERLFGTLQDRLVKELRLAGINSIEEANRFLPKYFERHNRRFMVTAAEQGDMHRPLPKRIDLNKILCIKTERTVRSDNTISLDGTFYQLHETLAGHKVRVEERVDGMMRIMNQDKPIRHHAITERPKKVQPQTSLLYKSKARKPAADHPWIGTFFGKKRPHKKPALSVAL